MQFFQERCCVVMTGCQENKSCSKVLNFLERLDDRIRCTHKETVPIRRDIFVYSHSSCFDVCFDEPVCWNCPWWDEQRLIYSMAWHAIINIISGSSNMSINITIILMW